MQAGNKSQNKFNPLSPRQTWMSKLFHSLRTRTLGIKHNVNTHAWNQLHNQPAWTHGIKLHALTNAYNQQLCPLVWIHGSKQLVHFHAKLKLVLAQIILGMWNHALASVWNQQFCRLIQIHGIYLLALTNALNPQLRLITWIHGIFQHVLSNAFSQPHYQSIPNGIKHLAKRSQ